jgi:hypothetical protein
MTYCTEKSLHRAVSGIQKVFADKVCDFEGLENKEQREYAHLSYKFSLVLSKDHYNCTRDQPISNPISPPVNEDESEEELLR